MPFFDTNLKVLFKGGRQAKRLSALLLSAGILTLLLSSCQKVIQVKLNAAQAKYVIEGTIVSDSGARVLLSQTKSFSEDNRFNGVSGAAIKLTDGNGAPVMLTERSPGVYESGAVKGQPGHTYHLSVQVNGNSFAATSTMPAPVPFDSLYEGQRLVFGETKKFVTAQYKDPAGKGNAYRFIQYVNGIKRTKNLFVEDDQYTDGRTVKDEIVAYGNDEEDKNPQLKAGDVVTIQMLCIDYPVYKYWYSLGQSATGASQSATPANPVSNISGGALGYFSAHTLQTRTLTIH